MHRPFNIVNLNHIVRDNLVFEKSADSIGLQLADIVASAIGRALRGNLKPEGWKSLGRLMFKTDKQTVSMLAFSQNAKRRFMQRSLPYGKILKYFDATSCNLLD